jgi:hypothetical protein
MQLVTGVRKLAETDDGRVTRRRRVGVNDRDRVRLVSGPGERGHVRKLLWRAGGGIARGPVEGRVVIVRFMLCLIRRHGGPLSSIYLFSIGLIYINQTPRLTAVLDV